MDHYELEHCLGFIKSLGFENPECLKFGSLAYRAFKDGEVYVLKTATRNWPSYLEHVSNEKDILERIKSIPKIVSMKEYHVGRYDSIDAAALVRDYIEGKTVEETKALNPAQCQSIEAAILALHDLGIADLDIAGKNIVVDTEGIPWLIDLGTATTKERSRSFNVLKYEDLLRMESMFGMYCRSR